MSKDRKIIYVLSVALVLALFGSLFLPRSNGRAITALTLVAFAAMIWFLLKKRPILSMNKKTVFWIMLAMGAVFLALYYLSGSYYGFYQTFSPLTINSFFRNVLPIATIIITIEVIRYVLLAQKTKFIGIFAYVAGVFSEVIVFSTLDYLTTFSLFMDAVGLYLLPAITANLLYNFLSKRYGFLPCIIYRLLTTLYLYVLPRYPQTPDALFSFAKMVVPLLIYLFVNALYAKRQMARKTKSKIAEGAFMWISAALMLSIVLFISGAFRYHLLVIATPSMTGTINQGDIIIYEKYDEQVIEEGLVVVFTTNDRDMVVHRVVEIQNLNGTAYYITKGDANDDVDLGYITSANLRGVVLYRLPNVGKPTLYLRNLFEKAN